MSSRIVVAGLQETKWFLYKVGDSVALSSGRTVPTSGSSHQRREGVAVLL